MVYYVMQVSMNKICILSSGAPPRVTLCLSIVIYHGTFDASEKS